MGLETATYINQLIPTNPTNLDQKSQGDDHLRLIKSVLKTTFPNITGAVNVTQAQLNSISGAGVLCPPGIIVIWSGTIANIPSGWKLCNGSGTISTGTSVPDLRGRFVFGWSEQLTLRSTGGSITSDFFVNTGSGGATTVTVSNTGWGTSGAAPGTGTTVIEAGQMVVGSGNREIAETLESLRASGNGKSIAIPAHTHTVTGTVGVLPPFYVLAYIIKD